MRNTVRTFAAFPCGEIYSFAFLIWCRKAVIIKNALCNKPRLFKQLLYLFNGIAALVVVFLVSVICAVGVFYKKVCVKLVYVFFLVIVVFPCIGRRFGSLSEAVVSKYIFKLVYRVYIK